MAVAAAGREGSLEPALGAGVGQGVQMRRPPCPACPLLGGGILTLAVPRGSVVRSLSQNLGYCLCTSPGGHCLSLPLPLRASLGEPWKNWGWKPQPQWKRV